MEEKAIFDLSTMGNVKRLITRRIPEPWNRDGEHSHLEKFLLMKNQTQEEFTTVLLNYLQS